MYCFVLSHFLGVAIAIYFHHTVPKQMFLYILVLEAPDIHVLYLGQSPCANQLTFWNGMLKNGTSATTCFRAKRWASRRGRWMVRVKTMEKGPTDFEASTVGRCCLENVDTVKPSSSQKPFLGWCIANLHLKWTFITGTEKASLVGRGLNGTKCLYINMIQLNDSSGFWWILYGAAKKNYDKTG